MPTIISEWIYCPVCGNKTRTMIREDTEFEGDDKGAFKTNHRYITYYV